jgi:hypothetical protein
MATAAALGATSVQLQVLRAPTVAGIRFSYQHALYEVGAITAQAGNVYTASIFPAIRAAIPAGADLEADRPTCLCHLASDTEMDLEVPPDRGARPTVGIVEAVDYWTDLALAG